MYSTEYSNEQYLQNARESGVIYHTCHSVESGVSKLIKNTFVLE